MGKTSRSQGHCMTRRPNREAFRRKGVQLITVQKCADKWGSPRGPGLGLAAIAEACLIGHGGEREFHSEDDRIRESLTQDKDAPFPCSE